MVYIVSVKEMLCEKTEVAILKSGKLVINIIYYHELNNYLGHIDNHQMDWQKPNMRCNLWLCIADSAVCM